MRRSIFNAGVWTALGLAIAFAVVSANSNSRHAATTAAPAKGATVATAAVSHDDCSSADVCCARETKATKAAVAAAPRKATRKAASAATSAYASGAVIAIDPETGELGMPSPTQMSELLAPSDLMQSDVGLVDVHHPNGMVTRDLQGRFQEAATITIGPDGKKTFGCGVLTPTSTTQPAPSALEEK